jgi:hypothetical protein
VTRDSVKSDISVAHNKDSKSMKPKRKRAPGGGRKPGEFGKLGAVMGLRLPDKLKEELEQAAKESGRSLSGEMIWQLSEALGSWGRGRSRERARDKAVYQMVREVDVMIDEFQSLVAKMKQDLGLKSKRRK